MKIKTLARSPQTGDANACYHVSNLSTKLIHPCTDPKPRNHVLGDTDRPERFSPLGQNRDFSKKQSVILSIGTSHGVHPDFQLYRFFTGQERRH